MNTITLVACDRPYYARHALRALARCRGIERFWRLCIFIDGGDSDVADVCLDAKKAMPIPIDLFVNEQRLGIAGNPLRAYTYVFDQLGAELNVAIEDDALLTPDALELALWFQREHGCAASRYAFLNFCDHYCYRGNGANKGGVPDDDSLLAETADLSSPFAWAFTAHQWPFVKADWNTSRSSREGWDWSLRFRMRLEGKVALTPVISRCRNIGKLGGIHESDQTYAVQTGLTYSEGSYRGVFTIVNPVSSAEATTLESWMASERPLRVISFSLWGSSPKYMVGAIRNAELAPMIYPGWRCRFYCASSVPAEIVWRLECFPHVELVRMREPGDWRALFWRFYAASDSDVSVMLSRDADSRLNAREAAAVEEWLHSDRNFHVMRDHPAHAAAILGGMWGVRNGLLTNIRSLADAYEKADYWQTDQEFLTTHVVPIVRNSCLEHDEYYARRPFPTARVGTEFVGQPFDEFDRPLTERKS